MKPHRYRRLFQSSHFRNLAYYGNTPTLMDCASTLGTSTPTMTFTAAYDWLCSNYPVEYVLKNVLLLRLRAETPYAYIRTEHHLPLTRADIISVGDACTAFELKTRYDSPDKILNQIKGCRQVFEYVVLMTEEGYSDKFTCHIPPEVGHYVLTSDRTIRILKPPVRHTNDLCRDAMLSMLDKSERIAFVEQFTPSRASIHRHYWQYSRDIALTLTPIEMHKQMISHLRGSQHPIRHLRYIHALPSCLTSAIYAHRLLVHELEAITAVMDTRIDLLPAPHKRP